jgi:hypothetical protein
MALLAALTMLLGKPLKGANKLVRIVGILLDRGFGTGPESASFVARVPSHSRRCTRHIGTRMARGPRLTHPILCRERHISSRSFFVANLLNIA